MKSLITYIVLFVLLIFAAVKFLAPEWLAPQPGTAAGGNALIGGAFEMTAHTGDSFTDKDLLGKYSLVFFGFTHCPDICPSTLLNVAEVMADEAIARELTPVFVSVDPKRDTVEHLNVYVGNFHPSIIGLTGTQEQLKQIADAYKVYYAVRETNDSALGYQVDHSGYLFLMDPRGQYITHFPHDVSPGVLRERINQEIRN